MGKVYRTKRRACRLRKPHKKGWNPTNKAKYLAPNDDIEERLSELWYIDDFGNIKPKRINPKHCLARLSHLPPRWRASRSWHGDPSLENKSAIWHENQLKLIEIALREIPLIGEKCDSDISATSTTNLAKTLS